MTISIRQGRSSDVELLVRFQRAMAAESEDKGLDEATLRRGIESALADPDLGVYWLADVNGETAGGLMVTWEWSDWRDGRFWWIQSVYVTREHRRQGVYAALHDHVRELARSDPRSCGIRLYVEKENFGAQATYQNMGMTETDYLLYEEEFEPHRQT